MHERQQPRSQSFSGSDQDAHHYATLDYDSESNTDHVQFRQYSSTEGRFLSPDPYGGSYDPANPQSFNRYEYALDNPLSNIDPSGLDDCTWYDETGACNGLYSFWFQMQVGAGGGATTIINGGCPMSNSICQMGYQNIFENDQLQFPVVSSGAGGGGGGGGGGAPNKIAKAICGAIPSGRTTGASGGLGGIGSVGGGLETVVNYSTGQVSGFYYGGVQIGWNGGASGSVYSGYVYGLNGSNSNYSGGFTGFNGGAGPGVFGASSSGGLTGGVGGLGVNPSAPGAVTSGGLSFGGGLLSGFAGGVTATNYSNPVQMGKFWAFDIGDWTMYAAKQMCKAAGF